MSSANSIAAPKAPRAVRMQRLNEKFGARAFAPGQSEFTRQWLTRNLRRWRRLINRLHPFRQDNLDDPARYGRGNR